MAAVWLRFRAELRERWRGWVVLALLVGVAGGVVLAALAGARRTDRAYPDFLESQHAYDMLIVSGRPPLYDFAPLDFDEIARLPQVAEVARAAVVPFFPTSSNGKIAVDNTVPLVTTDGQFGTKMNRLFILDGRAPRRPNEIVISFLAAERFNVGVGDAFDAAFLSEEQVEAFFEDPESVAFDELTPGRLHIVGIESAPSEFPPLEATATDPLVHFAPSFRRSELFAPAVELLAVRLQPGTRRAFLGELERRADGQPLFYRDQVQATEATRRSMGVQADALRIVALLAAVVGLLVVGQLLVRQSQVDDSDNAALRSLGMSPRQLIGLGVMRGAGIGLGGAAVAVVVAVALSPLTPVGLARKAETNPGVAFDGLVLAVGGIGVMFAALIAAAPAIWRLSRWALAGSARAEMTPSRQPSRTVGAMARAGFSPSTVTGVRFALASGRGPTASPARVTIIGVVLAVTAITAVTGFSASLDHLLATPRLYGWNWDAAIGDPFSPDFGRDVAAELATREDIGAVGSGAFFQARIAGARVDVLAIDSAKDGLVPTIVAGRAPRARDEIALGSKSLGEIDRRIGDRVRVKYAGNSTSLRVVGEAVLPDLASTGGLGRGAAVTFRAALDLAPNAAANTVLVRSASTRDRDAVVASLQREFGDFLGVTEPSPPIDLENVRQVDSMPFVMGALMVLVAIATIAHGLMTSVLRRRRDLALLKTLGMERRQVIAVVMSQAAVVATIALIVGVPLGIIVGDFAWTAFAEKQLGSLSVTVVSGSGLALLIPTVFLVAGIAAGVPGRIAARTKPATVLRSE